MSEYRNNQESANNDYDQSYKQEDNGQCSYSYTPKDTQSSIVRARIIRLIIFGAVSMLLLLMVLLTGIVFGAVTTKNFFGSSREGAPAAVSGGDFISIDHGISSIDVTEENLHYYSEHGIASTGIIVTGSEYTNSLKFGDKIVSVNGVDISNSEDIEHAARNCKAGNEIIVKAERDGEIFTVCIVLRKRMTDYVYFE